MRWCHRIGLLLALLLVGGCDRGPGRAPGLEGAGPLVSEFAQRARQLDHLASKLAENHVGDLPGSVRSDLTEVGEAARKVLLAAEPDGSSGVAAIEQALAEAAAKVVRHLVTTAGGHDDGPTRMTLQGPPPVVFELDRDPSTPTFDRRTAEDLAQGRSRLQADLGLEIERFIYVALLANPTTRSTLAPRTAPAELPASVDPNLNLSVSTREEWRDHLFDGSGRLVVPSPNQAARWASLLGWAEAVNPKLMDAVNDVTAPAFRVLFP